MTNRLIAVLCMIGAIATAVALTSLRELGAAHANAPLVLIDAGVPTGSVTATELPPWGETVPAPATVRTTPSPAPDPLADPGGTVDRVRALWRSGALPAALILAAFTVLVVLRRTVPWFAAGRRAVYLAAAIGGLGMLVEMTADGATPNLSMLLVALTTTVSLAMRPTPGGAA